MPRERKPSVPINPIVEEYRTNGRDKVAALPEELDPAAFLAYSDSSYGTLQAQHTDVQKGDGSVVQRTWPVPQIILYYGNFKRAVGRQAVAKAGKVEFLRSLYLSFVWQPPYPGCPYQDSFYDNSKFAKAAYLLGTFQHVQGDDDVGPVILAALGWEEMIQNVVKLELMYDE